MKPIIIAIDGYSSCGKSTIAKELSKILLYKYVDTGAMYRAVTLYFIQRVYPIEKKIRSQEKRICRRTVESTCWTLPTP